MSAPDGRLQGQRLTGELRDRADRRETIDPRVLVEVEGGEPMLAEEPPPARPSNSGAKF